MYAWKRLSYAWRSILYGRDLLEKCLLKLIGNGLYTSVRVLKWGFRWVPASFIWCAYYLGLNHKDFESDQHSQKEMEWKFIQQFFFLESKSMCHVLFNFPLMRVSLRILFSWICISCFLAAKIEDRNQHSSSFSLDLLAAVESS